MTSANYSTELQIYLVWATWLCLGQANEMKIICHLVCKIEEKQPSWTWRQLQTILQYLKFILWPELQSYVYVQGLGGLFHLPDPV